MKKKFAALIFLSMLIISISFGGMRLYAADSITVYLVLGKGANIKIEGAYGVSVDNMFLENTYIFNNAEGAELPKPDTRAGYIFDGWKYAEDGQILTASKVPAKSGEIYYAGWLSAINPEQEDYVEDEPEDIFADLYLSTGDSVFERSYRMQSAYSHVLNNMEYTFTGTFEAGFSFKLRGKEPLRDYANNPAGGNMYTQSSYPYYVSGQNFGYALANSETGLIKTNNYIEALDPITNQPVAMTEGTNNYWYSYSQNGKNTSGNLRFKTAGTYFISVRIWNNGGWVEIYTEPR